MSETSAKPALAICHNVQASLNSQECPSPLKMRGLGNKVIYKPEDKSNHFAGSFKAYGPSHFELHFPVTSFTGFKEIANSKEQMLADHAMTIRFLAEDETPVATANLTKIRFEHIGYALDQGGPVLVVSGIAQQTVI